MRLILAERITIGYAHGRLQLDKVTGGRTIVLAEDQHAVGDATTQIDLIKEVTTGPSESNGENTSENGVEGERVVEYTGDLPVDTKMLPTTDTFSELG